MSLHRGLWLHSYTASGAHTSLCTSSLCISPLHGSLLCRYAIGDAANSSPWVLLPALLLRLFGSPRAAQGTAVCLSFLTYRAGLMTPSCQSTVNPQILEVHGYDDSHPHFPRISRSFCTQCLTFDYCCYFLRRARRSVQATPLSMVFFLKSVLPEGPAWGQYQ